MSKNLQYWPCRQFDTNPLAVKKQFLTIRSSLPTIIKANHLKVAVLTAAM
jgi:hypothetical protein